MAKTALDSLEGCTCKPSYYTFHRDRSGRPVKGGRLRDRRVAERARPVLQADLDAGRVGIRQERNIDFKTWASGVTASDGCVGPSAMPANSSFA